MSEKNGGVVGKESTSQESVQVPKFQMQAVHILLI